MVVFCNDFKVLIEKLLVEVCVLIRGGKVKVVIGLVYFILIVYCGK